ncbi:MAG: serine protease [Rhodanobacter sp.]
MTHKDIKSSSLKITEVVEFDVGQRLQIAPVEFHSSDATQVPMSVKNWDVFEGAMLAVAVGNGERLDVIGTACMIACGLAVTAAHVFADVAEKIASGELGISCFGITSDSGAYWSVTELCYAPGEEIAYLSIARFSSMDTNRPINIFKLTTRAPKVGELVTMLGFRFPETVVSDGQMNSTMTGHLYAAKGPVINVYPRRHERPSMPFPVIEVDCGSLGGMSGGALLDGNGFLLGITSRGWETVDGLGPSYAAWLLGGLNRRVTISWPRGLYQPKSRLLDIDPRLLYLQGREHLKIIDELNYSYKIWFDSD